jgi:hypothetical protein
MDTKPLIGIKETIEKIKLLKEGFLIVGGPEEEAYGTVPDMKTLFVWTDQRKAEEFIKDNLDPQEDKVIMWSIEKIVKWARGKNFESLRFDFLAKGVHPKQGFVNYKIPKMYSGGPVCF